jgi:ADP-ribose pyrophosphatase YjhB (NUDIX family)
VINRGRVLLVELGHEPLKGSCSLPGGVIEAGESFHEGVRRELLERISSGAGGRPEYHYVVIDYLCRVADGELLAAGDATKAEWVRAGDLHRYRIAENTLEVIRRAFRGTKGRRMGKAE